MASFLEDNVAVLMVSPSTFFGQNDSPLMASFLDGSVAVLIVSLLGPSFFFPSFLVLLFFF